MTLMKHFEHNEGKCCFYVLFFFTLNYIAAFNLPHNVEILSFVILYELLVDWIQCCSAGSWRFHAEAQLMLDIQLYGVFNMVVNGKGISWQAVRAPLWWD